MPSPYSLGNPIEWKLGDIEQDVSRKSVTPYSLGNPIEWKLKMKLARESIVTSSTPYSLGNPIEWKLENFIDPNQLCPLPTR